jgi:hypothetical protein
MEETKMSNGNLSEDLAYKTLIDDIRYTKQQQWNTIYLTLIALAGIITLWFASEQTLYQNFLKWFLIITSFVITLLGIFYIRRYHHDLTKYRYRKNEIKNLIWPSKDKKSTKTVREILDGPSCDECRRLFYEEDFFSFVLPFWFVIILAEVLTILIIVN